MKQIATCLVLLYPVFLFSQTNSSRPFIKTIIVKTNVFNLALAKRPTLSVEKFLSPTFSLEASYVQGYFNKVLLTDHYNYRGFLLRAKKYFETPIYGRVVPYAGLYAGTLKRTIYTDGQLLIPYLFATSTRDFSANSIRAGGSFGVSLTTKSRVNIDLMTGMGAGRYFKYYKASKKSDGYLDGQLWLSVGYCF